MLVVARLNLNMSDAGPDSIAAYLSFLQFISSDLQEAAHTLLIVWSEKCVENDLISCLLIRGIVLKETHRPACPAVGVLPLFCSEQSSIGLLQTCSTCFAPGAAPLFYCRFSPTASVLQVAIHLLPQVFSSSPGVAPL